MARSSSARVDALLACADPHLPVWDLCCDGGQIGCVAMDRDAATSVVFVDKRPRLIAALESELASRRRYAGRYRCLCADVRQMPLPATPVTFIVAGVGTNLIVSFLARLAGRTGDRVVCSTSQHPERFEGLLDGSGFVIVHRQEVGSRYGRQTLWALSPTASR